MEQIEEIKCKFAFLSALFMAQYNTRRGQLMFSIKTFPFEIEGTKLGRILTLPGHNLLEEKLLIGDTITITI
jgi:hypothetical protein